MFAAMLTAFAAAAAVPSPTAGATLRPAPDATPSPGQRYCVVTKPTGSHIVRRDCRTRAQWLKDGFDPLAAEQN